MTSMEATRDLKFFEVGGCLRDELRGEEVHDVDFSVEASSFEAMEAGLRAQGFKVWDVRPETLTIRANVPKGHPLEGRTKDADFVMCRADGPSSDGRRPDFVVPGTVFEDLARRDFTVNAMARDCDTGEFLDPFGGREDLAAGVLRFVGDPMERIMDDGLRVVRGFRFMVTKGLTPDPETDRALRSPEAAAMLAAPSISVERIQIETDKMFLFDTLTALRLCGSLPEATQDAIFRDGLRLSSTLGGKKKGKKSSRTS